MTTALNLCWAKPIPSFLCLLSRTDVRPEEKNNHSGEVSGGCNEEVSILTGCTGRKSAILPPRLDVQELGLGVATFKVLDD